MTKIEKQLWAFVYDCASNFDCDLDAHRYDTTCRACDAQELLDQHRIKLFLKKND